MITIKWDGHNEMMEIKNGKEVIFFGNESDFNTYPKFIADFLKDCGIKDVVVKEGRIRV